MNDQHGKFIPVVLKNNFSQKGEILSFKLVVSQMRRTTNRFWAKFKNVFKVL